MTDETTNPSRHEAKEAYDSQASKDGQETMMPQVDWTTFIMSLSSSVLAQLGEVPDPESGQKGINLDMARHTINILGMLEEKTAGNLTPEEERQFKDILFELRMKYVQKSQ
ncbi:DUF1844 domain-containing protein [Desulfohalobium retbaense]|uniref:DUF1844 domain-containing protein n=1 Tax=Desulfohalobium retbaense (strain ATCC 49708 / DSM 5692 / JCM 16813 / HR100) TaxID=485915 RepID=C8X5J1_DESRD|nr:DUF1844 domain-containing protein [Desulfohalobium retbaense]ACV69688.1 Domain of unknown function DUF1844 [Desulfohalobium retbaense DSM 5692]